MRYGKLSALASIMAAAVTLAAPAHADVDTDFANQLHGYGIYGPKGLPSDVVDKVSAAVKKTLEDPAVKKRIEETGSLIVGNSPAEFKAQIAAEFEVYKKVVALQKLTLE